MRKIKSKVKDKQLFVRVPQASRDQISEREFQCLRERTPRGFLKPEKKQFLFWKYFEFSGPMGVSLKERLQKPITEYEFFYSLAQINDAIRKCRSYQLFPDHLLLDLSSVFINETTKELHFIYLPFESSHVKPDVIGFMEDFIYALQENPGESMAYVGQFHSYLRSMPSYDGNLVDRFIGKRHPRIIALIRKNSIGQSGYMTDKKKDYLDHFEKRVQEDLPGHSPVSSSGRRDTNPMKEWERDEATDLLAEPEDLWLERFDRDGGTDLLEENFAEEEQATDLLQEETPSWSDSVGMPVKIDGDSQLGTTLLAEESNFFASFHRLATHEDIVMNKLVFRFGKDASSDYCLSDNPAISRNHADIIAKGGRFYIKDLHSSNHTYVNDQQIPEGQEWEIHDGDNFRLGDEEFVVEL